MQYTYQEPLSGGYFVVTATMSVSPGSISSASGRSFGFVNVPVSGSVVTANQLTFQVSGTTFDPATLTWDIQAQGILVAIPFFDGGVPPDAAASDGVHTSKFTPTVSDVYEAAADIEGTSGGTSFHRTVPISFVASNPSTTFTGVPDAAIDTNGHGLFDQVNFTVQLTFQTAGTNQFSMVVNAQNGNSARLSGSASLQTGAGQIQASLPASMIVFLGPGPYQKNSLSVIMRPPTGPEISVASVADAGPTAGPVPVTIPVAVFWPVK